MSQFYQIHWSLSVTHGCGTASGRRAWPSKLIFFNVYGYRSEGPYFIPEDYLILILTSCSTNKGTNVIQCLGWWNCDKPLKLLQCFKADFVLIRWPIYRRYQLIQTDMHPPPLTGRLVELNRNNLLTAEGPGYDKGTPLIHAKLQ